ncbi:MAG TPA: molybdopterin molybdotransferase MoeA, partial [Terrimesophilobacter sp.]|nr:molybdopterin molybdotransferase MoeA [Terrimesophilobacter sp.]
MVKHAPNSPRSVSVEEHLARILTAVTVLEPHEMALADAHGLVLAADVNARVDVPGFDNSSMDGYAVRRADVSTASAATPVMLKVVADVPAGSKLDPPLGPGEAARIMTGAPLPTDADAIVPVEDVTGGIEHGLGAEPPATIDVLQPPSEAAFVRRIGSDVRAGDTVLRASSMRTAGRALGARDLAAAASAGVSQLLVQPAPRVGVLSTGSELRPAGSPLERGEIHDSNSVLITALIT